MLRSIKSVFVSLLMIASFISCEKEVSIENGSDLDAGGSQSGTAIFTLDGAPLNCVTPLISGDYIVGTALDVSNSVAITVNVEVAGTYVISTGIANGIRFEGSGTFAATGPQTITLFGTGTPIAAMTSSYSPGTAGCTFNVTAITGTVVPTDPFYYEATIDGVPYRVQVDGTTPYDAGFSIDGAIDVIAGSYIAHQTTPRPSGTTEFGVEKFNLTNYSAVTNTSFKAFFSAGTYPFAVAPANGVALYWGDPSGTDWATDLGVADQAGSNFTITSVVDEPGQTQYTVRVTAIFNCKLYDGAGNVKTLTNGKYVGLFSKL